MNMQIIETPKGFEITFEYRPKVVEEIKAIKGAKYFGSIKGWFIPKYQEKAVSKLKTKYMERAKGADAPEQYIKIAEMPELLVDVPLKLEPYRYQKNGIARGIQLKRFINGDEPGLGKTMQSIGTVIALNAFPCLVICPASLKENWRREFAEKFSDKRAIILSDKYLNTWHQYYRIGMAEVFIVNYESLRKYFVKTIRNRKNGKLYLNDIDFKSTISLFKSVVIDEIHKCKEATTLQSKLTQGICYNKDVVIGLTGTPVVNKPKDLAQQLKIIGRMEDLGGYPLFIDRYCKGGAGASNLNELNAKLTNICYFRREKKDHLKDLPEKRREKIFCDITNREEYDKATSDFKRYLEERGFTKAEVIKKLKGEIMVKIGLLKQIAAKGKIDHAIEIIQEVVDAGEKIVVFVHHRAVAEAFLKAFPGAVSVRGGDDKDVRQANIDRFQNDPSCQVIICSIKAASVGLTLTAASRELIVEFPWHAADVDQMEARIHRIGLKNAAQIMNLLGKDTIDERIYAIIEKKREIANTVMGATDETEMLIKDLTNNLFNQKAA